MLQGQDLAPVTEGALGQEPDFRQAVQDDPVGPDALESFEDALGRLAQLQVGGIKQALLLFLVEQAFRRDQFVDGNAVEGPAVRPSAGAQFVLGLG